MHVILNFNIWEGVELAMAWQQRSAGKETKPGIQKLNRLENQMSFFSEWAAGEILWCLEKFPLEITFEREKL